MSLIAMTQHTGVRWEEIGFALGAAGGALIALGNLMPFARRSGSLLGGIAIAAGFVLAIIGVHYGGLA
jgi:NO-binding membrane sensor protein with MHYT domain